MEEEFLTENTTLADALMCALANCTGNATAGESVAARAAAGQGGRDPRDPRLKLAVNVLVTLSYLIGIAGNTAALYILWSRHRAKRPRSSSKHALMLCCLAGNDLVALLGMLVQLYIKILVPEEMVDQHLTCVARVFWRLFGLGSGCVAAVMALERWLALTHPFLYQKHVTVELIFVAIVCLWCHVLVLVCLPFVGFGMYINKSGKCDRYRNATEPKDIAYAYLYFTFGTLLCFCIVWCNLAVVRALCHMNIGRGNGVGRRISRKSMSSSSIRCLRKNTVNRSETPTMTTKVTECAAVELNALELSQKCSALEHDDNKETSYHRLLQNSNRVGAKDSPQCNCQSCSQKPMLTTSSRNNSKDAFNENGNQQYSYNVCTSEEVAFARLMTILSISFVICWAPQMISILLAQFHSHSKGAYAFFIMSDILMSLHFTFDPYVYVLLRNKKKTEKPCLPFLKILCRQCSEQSQTTNEIELTERCVSHEEVS